MSIFKNHILNVTVLSIGISVIGLLSIFLINNEIGSKENQHEFLIIQAIEKAYFEGQKDFMNGDIRINKIVDSNTQDEKYEWIKSPWNNSDKELFYIP